MKVITNSKLMSDVTTNKLDKIPSILLVLFLIIDLIRLFEITTQMVGNILYIFVGAIAILYSLYKVGLKKQLHIIYFIFIYNFFGALSLLVNGNMNPQELLWPIAFIGMAIMFLNFKISHKVSKGVYYFLIAILMFKIIIVGDVNNLNTLTSRNTISVMVLMYLSIYIISCNIHNKKLTIYPILLGLLVNIMAIGRSGIITFLLLLILFLPFRFEKGKYRFRNPIKSIFVIVLGGVILWIAYRLLQFYFLEMIMNFRDRGLESVRNLIWSDYVEKTLTSLKFMFFGAPISGTYLLEVYKDNLHNSMFMLHAKYGVIPLVIIVTLIIKALVFFIKTENILYFITLLALIFRMQFDYTNFNAQLDIVLFYFIFFPYYIKN